MLKKILTFLQYWYFRYLLVTELYMVEKWEQWMMMVFLAVLSLFNITIVLRTISTILPTHSSTAPPYVQSIE